MRPFREYAPERSHLEQLYELGKYRITKKLVSAYIPEGYEQTEFYANESNNCTLFTTVLENADDAIIIQIVNTLLKKIEPIMKRAAKTPKYISNDILHDIMTNMSEYRAVWSKKNKR